MSNNEYPCYTLLQIAQIPEEELPDFFAELPDIIRHVRQILTCAEGLGAELKTAAPWPWRLLPVKVFAETVRAGIQKATFKNDKKGLVTLKAKISERGDAFYARTEKLDGAA